MKVLYIHSFYQHKGGEESVLEQEIELLKSDLDIRLFSLSNKQGIYGAIQFLLSIWNFKVSKKLKKEIHDFSPDVVHIHNWHFSVGPIVVRTAKKFNIPVIITLHNYRLICPSATFLIDNKININSIYQYFPWNAVLKKAYRNSFFQTFWLSFIIWFHKLIGTWKLVDKYIALTTFSKDLFLKSSLGLTDNQILVKPNFVKDKGFVCNQRSSHFLFVGRLSPEKGINILVEAFIRSGLPIKIVGDGPLKNFVNNISNQYENIQYLGSMTNDKILEQMSLASALVFPSIWFEGMPMTLVEAFSTGTPVIASDIGAMKSMVIDHFNGMLFEASCTDDLVKHLQEWNCISTESKNDYSYNCRRVYEQQYTPEINRDVLLKLYEKI